MLFSFFPHLKTFKGVLKNIFITSDLSKDMEKVYNLLFFIKILNKHNFLLLSLHDFCIKLSVYIKRPGRYV